MSRLIAGFDEAGKSSVAGPFVVAYVETSAESCEWRESKGYTASRRISLLPSIGKKAAYWGVVIADAHTVDRYVLNKKYLQLEISMITKLSQLLTSQDIYIHRFTSKTATTRRLLRFLKPKRLHVVDSEEKHPAVTMASIVATAARNLIMQALDQAIGIGDGETFTDKTWQYIERSLPCHSFTHIRLSYKPVRKRLEDLGIIDRQQPIQRLLRPEHMITIKDRGENLYDDLTLLADIIRETTLLRMGASNG